MSENTDLKREPIAENELGKALDNAPSTTAGVSAPETEKVNATSLATHIPIDKGTLKNILEAVLMASDKPLSLDRLQGFFEEPETVSRADLKDVLAQLQLDYAGRGVQLVKVASGYRFQSASDMSHWVSKLWEERPQKYSRALLETLSLIAYRQPITRGEIEEVRGVAVSSHIMKTLLERQWVKVVGHREVPGRPSIYATTKLFLDYFNLHSLEQLPPLTEMRDIDAIAKEVSEQLELEVADNDTNLDTQANTDLDTAEADNLEANDAVEQSVSKDEATAAETVIESRSETKPEAKPELESELESASEPEFSSPSKPQSNSQSSDESLASTLTGSDHDPQSLH